MVAVGRVVGVQAADFPAGSVSAGPGLRIADETDSVKPSRTGKLQAAAAEIVGNGEILLGIGSICILPGRPPPEVLPAAARMRCGNQRLSFSNLPITGSYLARLLPEEIDIEMASASDISCAVAPAWSACR
jgi:hypothetical protein